ncbi:MAG TPA: ferritin [Ignavibacteria bacterium]|nr:ferritin [Ignavibacteria bacterium]HAX47527.1 ferritin [Bacteroidota bacterium]HRE10504.1 ferritin [Ignavibacteria bacterium]HRF65166.1 ferritin [Ignavibacteria bacterium]HRJ03996.1 ferritin [Ignavibacteria bacterium]
MLSGKLQAELNKQMNNEFFAEYEYLSMAAYFHAMNLDGIANYFHVQAQEEHFHAMKIFHFILDKGGKVELQQIAQPDVTFKSPIEVFEKALGHEKKVTKSINDLMDDAIKENDHAVNSFLKWYVDEQVEEEALASKALGKMEIIGGKGEGLLILDQEYASRSFTPPAA